MEFSDLSMFWLLPVLWVLPPAQLWDFGQKLEAPSGPQSR
jgi:hypothetical protein